MHKPICDVLDGMRQAVPPLWLMRQAGRYLPEYMAVRGTVSGVLELCFTPKLAAEVTLQPIRRFGFDAAILFSDILVIPHALGRTVRFAAGEGPQLEPLDDRCPDPAEADNLFTAPFIRNERYGTRCSSVVAIDRAGAGVIIERRFDELGVVTGETALDFRWPFRNNAPPANAAVPAPP